MSHTLAQRKQQGNTDAKEPNFSWATLGEPLCLMGQGNQTVISLGEMAGSHHRGPVHALLSSVAVTYQSG